jgi:hypothetical protein
MLELGIVIAGLFIVVLIVPALTAGKRRLTGRLRTTVTVTVAVAAAWLLFGQAPIGQWCAAAVLLGSVAFVSLAATFALENARLHPVLAAAAVVVIGVAWLAWPVWLSPWLDGSVPRRLTAMLVEIHPPLVANGILTATPPWTELTVAYHLTVLNQDVPIAMPMSILPCVGSNLFLGLVLVVPCYWPLTRGARTVLAKGAAIGPMWSPKLPKKTQSGS